MVIFIVSSLYNLIMKLRKNIKALLFFIVFVSGAKAQTIGSNYFSGQIEDGHFIQQAVGQPFAVFRNEVSKSLVLLNQGQILPNLNHEIEKTIWSITVFPNPVVDNVTVMWSKSVVVSNLKLIDLNGKLIQELSNTDNSGSIQFNMSTYAAGIYVVTAETDQGEIVSSKITKAITRN